MTSGFIVAACYGNVKLFHETLSYSDVTRGYCVNKLHEVKYSIMYHRIGHPAGKMFESKDPPNMAEFTYDNMSGDKSNQRVSSFAFKLG